ncbi:acetyl-CoA hydrolase [Janibacter sp. YIM B02568]|uniref:acetyl-CoA hydrolase/transferase family protein n=1 Tax=Janibacter endophyticus TaxID=2806261 RepID=UPI0019517B27|nr:acetyl-CoA hydrolase/transferase C-terminal domain-containing protein [Janibacter endophyticus]MBM6544597.1 acetyl-CoA hydrolase [Janibacter endophyticus]
MRIVTVEEAARAAQQSGHIEPRIVMSGNFAAPAQLVEPILAQLPSVRLHALNAQKGLRMHDGVIPETAFVGPGFRNHPRLSYVPCRLSQVPTLFTRGLSPDVVIIHTTTPRNGKVSLGLEVNILPAAIEACRARGGVVIAQLNPQMPWTFGDAEISVDDIDLGVEIDVPLATHVAAEPGDDAKLIGSRVAVAVVDGSTLQAGIGEVPDATIAGVKERRNLRIRTEMFSDGVLRLEEAGALDRGVPIVTSFIFGSAELYAWANDNPRIKMTRTETANAPAVIAQQPGMTSINTALQVDLFDQANASRIKNRIYSGFGGQTDFTVGALHAVGGNSFMALRSWHPRADVSTIVPLIDEPATSFQHSAVVTEQGVAWIWGRDERTQARNLIEQAAHPRVRDELWEEARAMGKA